MVEKEYLSWEYVEQFIMKVIDHYKGQNITGVFGIPRGGLILASILSYKMNVPMLMAPCDNCIIIDDIADTGETLIHYDRNSSGEKRKNYHIVTMFYNEKRSSVKPEYYFGLKTDKWIVYPWENPAE